MRWPIAQPCSDDCWRVRRIRRSSVPRSTSPGGLVTGRSSTIVGSRHRIPTIHTKDARARQALHLTGRYPSRMLDATVTIRPATPADATALAIFGERTFREAFGPDNRPEDVDVYVRATYSTERQGAEIADPD